jgi:hypothetical protein
LRAADFEDSIPVTMGTSPSWFLYCIQIFLLYCSVEDEVVAVVLFAFLCDV